MPEVPEGGSGSDRPGSGQPCGTLIIGGGPAGLFAAVRLARSLGGQSGAGGASAWPVRVLERMGRPGRKLLVSGSGRCNIAHDAAVDELLGCYGGGGKPGSAARFLRPALTALDSPALLAWFAARGLAFTIEPNGKVFPSSGRASDVLAALLAEAASLGVQIITGCRALAVTALSGGGFLVEAGPEARPAAGTVPEPAPSGGPEMMTVNTILLATGGITWPVTGSSGDGYALAASLGHPLVRPRPALAAVYVHAWELSGLSGLSFRDAGLVLRRGGKRVCERSGDLLITHEGLSGPLVLDLSRNIEKGELLEIRFPWEGIEKGSSQGRATLEFVALLDDAVLRGPRLLVRTALSSGGLPRALSQYLCEKAGLSDEATLASLSRASRRELARLVTAFPLTVSALGGAETAMVTAGGVDLRSVDSATMESRLVSGLFFAGEILDYDGDTGGYNLHAAFATGALAAAAILGKTLR